MAYMPNRVIPFENRLHLDTEISMLPSPPLTSKKFINMSTSRNGRSSILGFKLSNLILTIVIGIIIIIEIKIMYETTKTYNESLVNQLSQKNELLERNLMNLTLSNNERNVLLEKLLKLNEEIKNETINRTGDLEDKIEETQALIVQMTKENKVMYGTGENNFMDTLKLVREALTMNTNTVIRLLDENNAIQSKLHNLEESVSIRVDRRGKWEELTSAGSKSQVLTLTSSSTGLITVILALVILSG